MSTHLTQNVLWQYALVVGVLVLSIAIAYVAYRAWREHGNNDVEY